MNFFIQRSELRDLYDKVAAGERISEADALRLFEAKDLNAVGTIADFVRQKKVGNRASYIINRYVNYSNYCILSCQFCSFARKKRDADGFELTIPQIVEKAREALKLGITELHIVGGLHPSLPFSYYTDMLKALRALNNDGRAALPRSQDDQQVVPTGKLQLKCFTAIEILHLAWLAKKSVEQTLIELKAAGLDSLTGGGAEIFRKEVRSQIARGKESAGEYLDVHRTWHRLGGRSTCTMLYGHVESLADRVDHLRQLRALQDETRGFCGFVPLAYQPENNDIPVKHPPTGFDSLRTIAVSRIYLDNFRSHHRLLGRPRPEAGAGGVELRRGRFARHDHRGTHLPHGRRDLAAIADRGGHAQGHPRSRPHAGAAQHVLRADSDFGKRAGG